MGLLRKFLFRHRRAAWLLVAMTLAMKALVPAGYMIGHGSKILTVSVCPDAGGGAPIMHMAIPSRDGGSGNEQGHDKAHSPCPFSVLSLASLAGADATLLTLALAFILALATARIQIPIFAQRRHLRPPLRGPPLPA